MIRDDIEDFLDRFSAAWNAGDAYVFASLFTDDATYVNCQGRWMHGKDEIAETHQDLFRDRGLGVRLHLTPLKVRALGPAVRVVVTAGGTGMQTFTLILRDGRWVCVGFHDTAVAPRPAHLVLAAG